jgi:hypothetical protein
MLTPPEKNRAHAARDVLISSQLLQRQSAVHAMIGWKLEEGG